MPRIERLVCTLAGAGFSASARLLEEAATAASAAAGFPPGWYGENGTAWVIRRSTIECAGPIQAGAELEVATWVADFRRVRSRRAYEVRTRQDLAWVLSAETDWVYVDRAAGRPKRIPDEMMRAFVPEGDPPALPREPLELGEPPADAATTERTVEAGDVDALEHVNNARYFDYVTDAVRSIWPHAEPRRQDLEYLDEARAGDRLICRTWALEASETGITAGAEIRRQADGALLTRSLGRWMR